MKLRRLHLKDYRLICKTLFPEKPYIILNKLSHIFTAIVLFLYIVVCITNNLSLFQIITCWIPLYLVTDFLFMCIEYICFKIFLLKFNHLESFTSDELSDFDSKVYYLNNHWESIELARWCEKQIDLIKNIMKLRNEEKVKETIGCNNIPVYEKLLSVIEVSNTLLENNKEYKKELLLIVFLLNKIKTCIEQNADNSSFISNKLFIYFNEFFMLLNDDSSITNKYEVLEILDELKIYLSDILYQIENCKKLHTDVSISVLLKELKNDNQSFRDKNGDVVNVESIERSIYDKK